MNTKMNVKKLLVAAGVVILGVALFFAGTTFAQTDEGNSGREWSEMMGGQGWEHESMHTSSEGVECPYDADHADHADHAGHHADHMDGWEAPYGAMHGAYGGMMGDWAQPESGRDAPAGEAAE